MTKALSKIMYTFVQKSPSPPKKKNKIKKKKVFAERKKGKIQIFCRIVQFFTIPNYFLTKIFCFFCRAVGPRFNSSQDQGILKGLFCSASAWHTTPVARRVSLVLEHFPFTNAVASGCMQIWFADSIPALVSFLRARRFPPTPTNRNPSLFWSIVSGLTLCVQDCLVALVFIARVCAAYAT